MCGPRPVLILPVKEEGESWQKLGSPLPISLSSSPPPFHQRIVYRSGHSQGQKEEEKEEEKEGLANELRNSFPLHSQWV